MQDIERIKVAKLLISRLEKISTDSIWAHRSSGIRGSLLKIIDYEDETIPACVTSEVDELISRAYEYLENACLDMLS